MPDGRSPRDCLRALQLSALAQEIGDLFEAHAPSLTRYATGFAGDPEAARDAVQEAFLRYFELRSTGEELKQPKAWLTRVMKNALIDSNRRERRERQAGQALTPDPPWHEAPAAGSENLETEQLWRRIGELVSAKELECLRLRAAGFSYAEIARKLGVQQGTVAAMLNRGREKTGALRADSQEPQPAR